MKTILVIEDNDLLRMQLLETLAFEGYSVIAAATGDEGVNLARTQQPDLIICDIMIPVLDGFGVLTTLRKDSTTKGIPFVFLTSRSDHSDFKKGLELGAQAYLVKPFPLDELGAMVEEYTSNSLRSK